MRERTKVLLVDPDLAVRAELARALEQERAEIAEASGGEEALRALAASDLDLVLCALVLPDLTGLALCRLLREDPTLSQIPVLMVSAHAHEMDRILAFECGVDDFLARPFFPRELLSRVRAVLRRRLPPGGGEGRGRPPNGRDGVALDPTTRTVRVDGRRVDLTPKEFDLLSALMSDSERVLSRDQLIERAWGPEAPQTSRTVDAHMKSVRRKLGPARDCVQTVRGVGYRFCPPQRA